MRASVEGARTDRRARAQFREFRHTIARLSGAPAPDAADSGVSDGDGDDERECESPQRRSAHSRSHSVSLPPEASAPLDAPEPREPPPPPVPETPSGGGGLLSGLTSMIFDAGLGYSEA